MRDGPFGDLKVPLTWMGAVGLLVAVIMAVAFLATDRRETFKTSAYETTRKTVDGVAAPVSGAVAAPVRWGGSGLGFISSYFNTASENRRLRQEVAELRQVRDMAIALRATNQRYEALLGLRTDPDIPMVTARTISDSRGPFSNTRLADAGADRGIAIGNPVINDRGLVGRVIGVGPRVSRVLMLTDVASRTPVMVNRTNARAILTGDGGPNPKLAYLRTREPLRPGDLIVTSGDGGVFPRGLPVGVAVRSATGGWRVALAADAAPIDFVKVMLFRDFSQLLGVSGIVSNGMPTPDTEDPRARAGTGLTPPPPRAAPPAPAPATATPPANAARPPVAATRPPAAAPSPATPAPASRPPASTPARPPAQAAPSRPAQTERPKAPRPRPPPPRPRPPPEPEPTIDPPF